MEKILISCITPTYNRSKLLKRAIKSTILQSYRNWEMIIVDDSSVDDTEAIVAEFINIDNRIKYFKNPGKGANSARNYGINQAKGEWIAFLDDDVENLPNRFGSQLNAAIKNGCAFILSGYKYVNQKGEEKICNDGLWGQGAGITSRWFIRKELLIKAGLFDESMPAMQENELSYRIFKYEIFANHFDIVTKETIVEDSVSKGMNGIRGSEIIVKKYRDVLDKRELAWWYYKIAVGYYLIDKNRKEAMHYFSKARKECKDRAYHFISWYMMLFGWLSFGKLKSLHVRIISILCSLRESKIVDHKIIMS